jgi:hypothetical protein
MEHDVENIFPQPSMAALSCATPAMTTSVGAQPTMEESRTRRSASQRLNLDLLWPQLRSSTACDGQAMRRSS